MEPESQSLISWRGRAGRIQLAHNQVHEDSGHYCTLSDYHFVSTHWAEDLDSKNHARWGRPEVCTVINKWVCVLHKSKN